MKLLLVAAVIAAATPATQAGPGIVIFPASQIAQMLAQCSRATPKPGAEGWNPTPADIARMEKAVAAAIEDMAKKRPGELAGFPAKYGRQYVGYVRDGRRYIYGNFGPPFIVEEEGARWRLSPIVICDGGVGVFGAEYDVEAGKVTHLAFNGYA